MRAVLLTIAAAATLAGQAEARTISLSEFVSGGPGAMSVRGARIEMTAPAPVEALTRAEMLDAGLLRCAGPHGTLCLTASPAGRREEATLTIVLQEGFSLSKLSFGDLETDSAFARSNPSVIVNGVFYTLEELSGLTLDGGRLVINLDSLAAAGLTLRSFEVSDLSTPLPAAGLLMLFGLGGFAAALRTRKKA